MPKGSGTMLDLPPRLLLKNRVRQGRNRRGIFATDIVTIR